MMRYKVRYSAKFKKSLRLCQRRGYDMDLFTQVAGMLAETGTLPARYKPHKLSGKYKGCWECHIKAD